MYQRQFHKRHTVRRCRKDLVRILCAVNGICAVSTEIFQVDREAKGLSRVDHITCYYLLDREGNIIFGFLIILLVGVLYGLGLFVCNGSCGSTLSHRGIKAFLRSFSDLILIAVGNIFDRHGIIITESEACLACIKDHHVLGFGAVGSLDGIQNHAVRQCPPLAVGQGHGKQECSGLIRLGQRIGAILVQHILLHDQITIGGRVIRDICNGAHAVFHR